MATSLQELTIPTKVTGNEHFATEYNQVRSYFNNNMQLLKKNTFYASGETDFNTLISAAGDAVGNWLINDTVTLTADRTIQAGVTLIPNGGYIDLAGFTLTGTNTKIEAGLNQIFTTNGAFAGIWEIKEVYPENFGAAGDSTGIENGTDDSLAINKACELGKLVVLNNSKIYRISSSIIPQNNQVIVGTNGKRNINIYADTGVTGIDFSGSAPLVHDKVGLKLQNIRINGGAVGLKIHNSHNCIIEDCIFSNQTLKAVDLQELWDSQLSRVYFYNMQASAGNDVIGLSINYSTEDNTNQIVFDQCVFEAIKPHYNAGTLDGNAYCVKMTGNPSDATGRNYGFTFNLCHFEPQSHNTYMIYSEWTFHTSFTGGTNFTIQNDGEVEQINQFYINTPLGFHFINGRINHTSMNPSKSPFYLDRDVPGLSQVNLSIWNLSWETTGSPSVDLCETDANWPSDPLYGIINIDNVMVNGHYVYTNRSQIGIKIINNDAEIFNRIITQLTVSSLEASGNKNYIHFRKEEDKFSIQSYGDSFTGVDAIVVNLGTPEGQVSIYPHLRLIDPVVKIGNVYLWADSSNKIRTGTAYPSDLDTEGTIVGTQT